MTVMIIQIVWLNLASKPELGPLRIFLVFLYLSRGSGSEGKPVLYADSLEVGGLNFCGEFFDKLFAVQRWANIHQYPNFDVGQRIPWYFYHQMTWFIFIFTHSPHEISNEARKLWFLLWIPWSSTEFGFAKWCGSATQHPQFPWENPQPGSSSRLGPHRNCWWNFPQWQLEIACSPAFSVR